MLDHKMRFEPGILLVLTVSVVFGSYCPNPDPNAASASIASSIDNDCLNKVRQHVRKELVAAFDYLALGSHFLRDDVNRRGFAKFFLESASEERQHALGLIHYLGMRGNRNVDFIDSNLVPDITVPDNLSGLEALRLALGKEREVTENIKSIITHCDGESEWHLSDFLTSSYMTEQHHGLRQLSGIINNLSRMQRETGNLAEFMMDQKLLKRTPGHGDGDDDCPFCKTQT